MLPDSFWLHSFDLTASVAVAADVAVVAVAVAI